MGLETLSWDELADEYCRLSTRLMEFSETDMGLVCDVCGQPKTNSAMATRLYEMDNGKIDLYVGPKLHGCNLHRAADRVVVPDEIVRREIEIAGMD